MRSKSNAHLRSPSSKFDPHNCVEEEDTEVIVHSKSKGKSLKVSSSSSESSNDSIEDTTRSVESWLADILYNSESSERFNSEKTATSFILMFVDASRIDQNYEGKLPPGFIKLQAGEDLKWKVNIEQHGNNFFIIGWKKVMDDIPLHLFSMVIFNFVSFSILRMVVFKPSGIQALMPLEANEKYGYDMDDFKFSLSSMKGDKGKVKFNHRFMQAVAVGDPNQGCVGVLLKEGNYPVKEVARGENASKEEVRVAEGCVKAGEAAGGLAAFVGASTGMYNGGAWSQELVAPGRLPIGVVTALMKSGERRIRMGFEEGDVNEFLVKKTVGKDPRYGL
ncbi:hypothetical protein E3N88_18633 [Mikania micrantha]|uniref:TF-B3 domain-containing protein n=1 Tax=Mikania micrantha TaxID=192012 RepID=A0A5N6NNX4_9ASTR|nr:hypothetical protein E3N88_18633 [Mikania micrantha]